MSFNCPLRNETCIRKRCYFWVKSNCAILNISTSLDEINKRLDVLEEKIQPVTSGKQES